MTNGGKNANGYGIIGSGVAVGSGGINPSINTLGLLSTFNSTFLKIVKELLRVWIEKLWSFQNFQCKLHESLGETYA